MKISSNIKDVLKGLKDFEKKQVPYATQIALNNTAEVAMKYFEQKLHQDFNITSSWAKVGGRYGIKKKGATKSRLSVEIFIPQCNTWIEDHEDGDTRNNQLIPTRYFKQLFPTLKTNRSIKKKAQTLLSDKSKNRIFEANIGGDTFIFQRKKGKEQGVRQTKGKSGRLLKAKKVLSREAYPLFLVAPVVKEKARLGFYDAIISQFNQNFNKEFSKAFALAMRTAK